MEIIKLNKQLKDSLALKKKLTYEYNNIDFETFSENIKALLYRYKDICPNNYIDIVEIRHDKLLIKLFDKFDLKINIDNIYKMDIESSIYLNIDKYYGNYLSYMNFVSQLSNDLYYEHKFKNEFHKHLKHISDKYEKLIKITDKYYRCKKKRLEYINHLKLDILLDCLSKHNKMMGHKGFFEYSGYSIRDFRYVGIGERKGTLKFEVQYNYRDDGDYKMLNVKKYNFLDKLKARIKRFPPDFVRTYKLELFMNEELNITL